MPYSLPRNGFPMTYPDAIQFLYELRWFGAKFGLENTLKLAELAGNPHHRLRFIHVAGTNGKGSTCAMLESIYRATGLKVGLFTSPHLISFAERIQVNRQPISEADVGRLVAEMQSLLAKGWPACPGAQSSSSSRNAETCGVGAHRSDPEPHPTFFEVVTVMALRYFAEQNCDLVIWETGLGGRLDATNIVTPLASVITNIQFDHQQWLGHSLASIAAEKAGIIKPGIPVLTAADAPEALRVIEETARQKHAPLTIVRLDAAEAPRLTEIELPLPGRHQRLNAALALATVRTLLLELPVSEESVRAGLSTVHWPGRLQLITQPSGQKILLDGAHNVAGAETLAGALTDLLPSPNRTLILGMLQDKDCDPMCKILAPLAKRILLSPVPSERSASPHELAHACRRSNPTAHVRACANLQEALNQAAEDEYLAIAGSLYLIGEAMELLHCSPAAPGERSLNEWVVRS